MDVNYQKKRFNITEAIDFVTAGDVSELSDLSEDEEYDNDDNQMHLDAGDIETFKAKESDNEKENFSDEDDIPLAQLADIDKKPMNQLMLMQQYRSQNQRGCFDGEKRIPWKEMLP